MEGAGEERARGVIGGGREGVFRGGGVNEGFKHGGGGKLGEPSRVGAQGIGGERAGGVGLGQDEGAEQYAFDLGDGAGLGSADAFEALLRGLLELLHDQGAIDAELLGRVFGELVANDGIGNAADVGEQEVEGVDLGLRGAGGGRGFARGR